MHVRHPDVNVSALTLEALKSYADSMKYFIQFPDADGANDAMQWRASVCTPLTSMQHVLYFIIIPDTKPSSAVLVDTIANQSLLGAADTFVSVPWRAMTPSTLVESLRTCVPAARYFWLDMLSVNQHQAPGVMGDTTPKDAADLYWLNLPKAVLSQPDMKRFVLVVDNWESPNSLTRLWCLWELFCGILAGHAIHFAMTRLQLSHAAAARRTDPHEYALTIARIANGIDAHSAICSEDAHRLMITKAIDAQGGRLAFNRAIRGAVLNAYTQLELQHVQQRSPGDTAAPVPMP